MTAFAKSPIFKKIMIEVEGLNKQYGSRWAVKDISFTVRKGEVVGFLGPNGAGKTTTMKMIAGALLPSSGEVRVDGISLSENPQEAKAHIGYLPEIPPVYGDMSVKSYLSYVAFMKKHPRSTLRTHLTEVMRQTGLQAVGHRWIQNLSKGYRQRVGLAQALLTRPAVLILDEPTVGLDPGQVIEMRTLISRLKGRHTIILSSHILSEVQVSCDRVIIIQKGRIVTQESLSTLRTKHIEEGKRKLVVRVKKPSKTFKPHLLKHIKNLDNIQEDQPGVYTLSSAARTGPDFNEEVAKTIIQGGFGLMELGESFRLEDVFLRLTESKKSSAPKDQKPPNHKGLKKGTVK